MAMEDTARSGRRFMLRTAQSLPLEWAFDTGLRPRPFPDEAASLLPGPLAVTRTGLTPASDDELTTQDQPPTRSTSCLWAHGKGSLWSSSGLIRTCGPPPPAHSTLTPIGCWLRCSSKRRWPDI